MVWAPRVVEIEERENRIFPREDLFDSAGYSLVLPETRALSAVELKDVREGVNLRALGLIGYLPLTGQIVLNLRPKFPVKNLWRMLAIADNNYDRMLPVLRSYEQAREIPPHQLLARGFCYYLRAIMNMGLARSYYREPYTGFYKPKVDFSRTVARHLSRGDDLTISGDVFGFSANLPVNAVLKSACLAFLRLIPRDPKWLTERKLLLEGLNSLHRVRSSAMLVGGEALANTVPRWLQDHYHGALSVYAMLLGYTDIGFGYEAQGSKMPSFLFSLDEVFESFVRNVFRTASRERKVAVLDGNNPKHHGRLFLDSNRFPTKPDLIFHRKKAVIGLAEVKYKPEIKEHDRYQLLSHVLAAQCKIGVWISPRTAGRAEGLEYIGSVATGAKFYHYQIDIGNDLDKASAAMIEQVTALLND
ncbi:5-methylcytosine restriction system specificity protein McrC [Sphingomonas sp. NPDC019816]|uniref:5-methylcytosine restriction system specificity protein McrC n=1 Tax=Sphingomonas sp. NPDC019816 TaxID=3390679 RepID=UPI003CFECF42